MAGDGVHLRTRLRKGKKETQKPRQSKNVRSKKKRVQEIIDISSSFHESDPRTVQENATIDAKTEDVKNDKDLRYEVSEVRSEIKELRVSMNKLTSYIETTSPVVAGKIDSPNPITITNTPRNSSVSDKTKSMPDDEKGNRDHEFFIGKRLFQPVNDGITSIYYINNQPLNTHRYDGRTTGVEIPFWYPVSYRVPANMVLDDLEASIAAYIFWVNNEDPTGQGDEVLIKSSWGEGKRFMLNCLNPGGRVNSKVLNQLAARLTAIEKSMGTYFTAWFLPTTFAIFVPINDDNDHWYLMVVDMFEKRLTILDSFPTEERREWRRRHVKKLALCPEEILDDHSFYETHITSKPLISDFALHEPDNLPKQDPYSNDCGIWVALWMSHCIWNTDYDKINVKEETRMRIAIDLVLHKYNNIKEGIVSKASDNWVR
ncbi:Ulp1 protease family, C-terminal catalytic domain [Sesbania bispinosa]|nr:Ulp1 protease family, C-terminal catalytic domain [Sesbania bispinosa]